MDNDEINKEDINNQLLNRNKKYEDKIKILKDHIDKMTWELKKCNDEINKLNDKNNKLQQIHSNCDDIIKDLNSKLNQKDKIIDNLKSAQTLDE